MTKTAQSTIGRGVERLAGQVTGRRGGFAIVIAVVSMLFVGAALTGGYVCVSRASEDQRTLQGAATLAEKGLTEFAMHADVEALERIPLGAGETFTRARIESGAMASGTYAVTVARTADAQFFIKSTGRLSGRGLPMICSFAVHVSSLDVKGTKARLAVENAPLCNGHRYGEGSYPRALRVGT
jgi:hypothetical protein